MFENLKNPQMLAMMNQSPDTKFSIISQDGWSGLKIVEKNDAKIVAFCDSSLITISVSKADEEALSKFWKAVDLKAMAAALPKGTPKNKAKGDDNRAGPAQRAGPPENAFGMRE